MSVRVNSNILAALLTCAREHDWSRPPDGLVGLLDGIDATSLAAAARAHRISNIVYVSCKGLPGENGRLASSLSEMYRRNAGRRITAGEDLRVLSRALDEAGIRFLAVKGPVVSELLYPRSDLRAFWDLDLVVSHESLWDAVETMRAAGCSGLTSESRAGYERETRGQVHLHGRHGTPIDLHWHLLNRSSLRRPLALDMDALFERARIVTVAGASVRTLDPTDTLFHLALHAGLGGANRLSWLKDVDRAVRAETADWDELARRVHAAAAEDLVAVALRRARTMVGAPIPLGVVDGLATTGSWQRLVALCERIWPSERSPNGPTVTKMVTRAARRGVRPSVVALAGRLLSDVSDRMRRRRAAE
jgi:putative nucleotidyltransferase-like protein